MYRVVDLGDYVDAELNFSMWLQTESGSDHFKVGYYEDDSWYWDWSDDTDTSGWEPGSDHFSTTFTIPNTASRVGFRFSSDTSTTHEGAYVDDVLLTGDTGSDTETVLSDDFESGFAWTVEDEEEVEDDCGWGRSDYRAYSGDYSAYCAQEGGYPYYCDDMNSVLYRDVDLGGYAFARMDFRVWLETESGYDYLDAGYFDEYWHWVYRTDVDATDWELQTIVVPAGATRIGFRFSSDGSTSYEGAYVDDVVLTAHCGAIESFLQEDFEDEFDWAVVYGPGNWGRSDYRSNSGDHSAYCAQEGGYPYYCDNMATIMYRPVDLTGYVDGELDFSMWLETESGYDSLDVGYYDGSWHWDWSDDTDTSGWQLGSDHFPATFTIPNTASFVGFRFSSDSSNTYEGAYVDDVVLTGNTVSDSETVLSDDFESGFAWTVGLQYGWGLSNHKASSPSHSAYCAIQGVDWAYANNMTTIMYRPVDLTGYVDAELDFDMWLETESSCDYLDVGYYDGSWHWDWSTDSDTTGWESGSGHFGETLAIPSTASRVGFRFASDYSTTYEGAYVDEVLLNGNTGSDTETVLSDDFESGFAWTVETIAHGWGKSDYRANSGDHSAYCAQEGGYPYYWDYMHTVMYRAVDIGDCGMATLDFSLWLETESDCDYFSAGYFDDTWHWIYETATDTSGWESRSLSIPSSATLIGFRFSTDSSSTYEGAYIDDLTLTGFTARPCGEQLEARFSAQPRVGLAPLKVNFVDESDGEVTSWLWRFGDGTHSTEQNPSHVYRKAGRYNVSLKVSGPDGSDVATTQRFITVKGGGDNRPPEPASLGGSYLVIDPAQVLPNQEVVVSANVCNSGEERGSRTVSFMVNGETLDSQSVSVSGGACQPVVFRISRAVPGTYQVAVDGMVGQFSVLAPTTVIGNVPSQQQPGLGTAGVVAIIAVAIVLILALIVLFRRR